MSTMSTGRSIVIAALLSICHGFAPHQAPALTPKSFLLRMDGTNGNYAAPFGSKQSLEEIVRRIAVDNIPKKKIALLGSTGSIGTQTLDICRERPDLFECVSLAAGNNIDLLSKQIAEFHPQVVSIQSSQKIDALVQALDSLGVKKGSSYFPEIVAGDSGIVTAATVPDADVVVTGIVGCAGLLPTIAAIKAKKDIALANKETLIAGGPVVVPLLKEHKVNMLPADSEHSAIFQCLQGLPPNALQRILLTASGGAFRDWPKEKLSQVTVKDALKHPNWAMGAKITVDSATMMNKGLEVIEAHYLFGTGYDNIDIVVHPQSIIHSAIETVDTSIIAQLGLPDMRLPLLYSISYPHRVPMPWKRLDLAALANGQLTFFKPDLEKYPCISLAYAAGRQGGSMTAVLNAANERANELFRQEQISFLEISQVIERVMNQHNAGQNFILHPSLEDIVAVDEWARRAVEEVIAVQIRGSKTKATV